MAVSVLDNFDYAGKKPNFARDLFDSIEEMVAYSENYLPEVFEANVRSTGKRYRYNVNNPDIEGLGRWREVSSGSSGASSYTELEDKPKINDVELSGDNSLEDLGIVQSDWAEEDETSHGYIKNKPSLSKVKSISVNGEEVEPDESGNVDINVTGGSTTAEDVSYENESYPSQTNVKKALDAIWAKIDYVKPSISSFTMSPSTTDYEIGQEVTELNFTWTYNKEVTSQSLTDVTLEGTDDRSGKWTGSLKTNKTFTLSCGDGQNTATASKSISFKNKTYWGSAALQDTYDSAFILGLSNKQFSTAKKGTYSMTVADGEYGFLTMPKSYGNVDSTWIGGFEVELTKVGDISFENASGGIANYSIYRTGKSGLGAITMEVK